MKEILLLYLQNKYPINKLIEEYIKYRGQSIDTLYKKYTIKNTFGFSTVIPVQIIADTKMRYILDWLMTEFNITSIIQNNKIIGYV